MAKHETYFVGRETFNCPLIMEGSWGERDIGTHESTMELYFHDDATGFIEWDIPTLDKFEYIGLWFSIDQFGIYSLKDYDGVMSLSDKAIALLRKHNVIVPPDFE